MVFLTLRVSVLQTKLVPPVPFVDRLLREIVRAGLHARLCRALTLGQHRSRLDRAHALLLEKLLPSQRAKAAALDVRAESVLFLLLVLERLHLKVLSLAATHLVQLLQLRRLSIAISLVHVQVRKTAMPNEAARHHADVVVVRILLLAA